MQHDQQLQSSQVSKYPSAAKVTAAQGAQRATSSTDEDEDVRTQRSLWFIFQPKVSGKFLRMILFTALMAGVSKSMGLFWEVWGGIKEQIVAQRHHSSAAFTLRQQEFTVI